MVKSFFKNGQNLLFQEQKTILSAAAVISFMVLTSSFLGLVKMRLYAGILGVGPQFDVFVAAFRIPDLIFQLVIVGSLNAAFIPLFSGLIAKESAQKAWGFASNILNLTLIFFGVVSAVVFIFAKPLSFLVAAGFDPKQTKTLIELTRIFLLSPILLGVSSLISGSLQSFKRFFFPFLSPIAYNLGAIFGALFLYQPLGLSGLAWGVVLGSFLHLIIQLPLLFHLGFRYQLKISWRQDLVKKMFGLSAFRTIGLGAEQIKSLILINIASFLGSGAISVLRFGESIATVPISVIGAAIAQAALPTLSQEALTDLKKFKETFLSTFFEILYLSLPLSIILIILKIPIVRLILGVGNFSWNATISTAWVLALFSLGIFAQCLIHLVIRAFYALQDTRNPLIISLISIVLSLILAVFLSSFLERLAVSFGWPSGLFYGVRGLVLGITLGTLIELGLLFFKLHQKLHFTKAEVLSPGLPIVFASIIMALTIYFPVKILDQVFLDTTRTVNLVILVWLVLTLGGSTYLLLTWLLGCKEIRIFFKVLVRLKNIRENLLSFKKLPLTIE